MDRVVACRVCLATDNVKLDSIYEDQLSQAYEILTGNQVSRRDGLPQHICSYCSASLRKSFTFKEKCCNSQHLLKCCLSLEGELSMDFLRSLDREMYKLSLPYRITSLPVISCECDEQLVKVKTEVEDAFNSDTPAVDDDNVHVEHDIRTSDTTCMELTMIKHEETETQLDIGNIKREDSIIQASNHIVQPLGQSTDGRTAINICRGEPEELCEYSGAAALETPAPIESEKKYKAAFLVKQEGSLAHAATDTQIPTQFFTCKLSTDGWKSQHVDKYNISEIAEFNETVNVGDGISSRNDLLRFPNSQEFVQSSLAIKLDEQVLFNTGSTKEKTFLLGSARFDVNDTQINKKLSCDRCPFQTNCKMLLSSHLKAHYGKKSFACDMCYYRTINKTNLITHIKSHLGTKKSNSFTHNKTLDRRCNVATNLRIHTGKKAYSCHACKKVFNRRSDLITHLKVHTVEKPYACYVCKKAFSNRGLLNRHLKIHTGEKAYSCDLCDKAFSQRSHLTTHLRIHTGEKPFACHMCKEAFIQQGNLTRHLRVHTGEKAYSCHVCKKAFSQRSNLTIHMRIHTGEKTYACHVCKKTFIQQNSLNIHSRVHTGEKPYDCHVCKKEFTHQSNLNTHLRIHTGEKPYSCHMCKKAFRNRGLLTAHLRVHTGEKAYSCHVCNKAFNQRNYLTKHLRIHSGEKASRQSAKYFTHLRVHDGEEA